MKHVVFDCGTGQTSEIQMTEIDIQQIEANNVQTAWQMIREQRNYLLSICDWTVLSDTPTSTAAWKTYRQALRDLPANTTDPFNPVWPTPPS